MATEKTLQILEEIKGLTILELADLVKALEEEFGVSAAPVAVAGAAAPAEGGAAAEEKTEFDVILADAGASKLGVIKVVREITGLGLAESKAMAETPNAVVKEAIAKEAAEEMVKKFAEAGAKAVLK